MTKIIIEKTPTKDDFRNWLATMKVVWPLADKTYEELLWAFYQPYISCPVVHARLSGQSQIMGTRGAFYVQMKYGNDDLKCIQVGDTCVHPDARRHGIFSRMNREFVEATTIEGYNFIYNVSVDVARKAYEKLGWKYLRGFNLYVRPRGLTSSVRVLRNIRAFSVVENDHNEHCTKLSDDDIDRVFSITERTSADFSGKIFVTKDRGYLSWRLRKPTQNYRLVVDNEFGYIIYKLVTRAHKIRDVFIGEIRLLGDKDYSFQKLLSLLKVREEYDIVSVMLSKGHPYYKVINENFIRRWKSYNFGTRELNAVTSVDIFDLQNWAVSSLDIDTY